MKIGVISDTHIPISADCLPQKIYDYFKECDLIIHAGDAIEKSVIDELGEIAETKAVQGNMDSNELKQSLPEKMVLNIAGKKIGVIHGKGAPFNLLKRVSMAFGKKLDIIIFGHSHTAFNEKKDGVLFFNPGSATGGVLSKKPSFGIIEINGDEIRAEIITC
ncbi:MAG: metallophosphoesterase family protein [Candidatus Omnitrophota bacterium]